MTIVSCQNCGAKNRIDQRRATEQQPVCGRCGAALPSGAAAHVAGGKPIIVTDASFAADVLGSGATPVLLDCWAAWCGPCRMLAPTIDQLAAEANGRFRVGKLNVDENPRTAGQFQISSIPAMLIFKNGKMVDQIVGLQPKGNILAKLQGWVG